MYICNGKRGEVVLSAKWRLEKKIAIYGRVPSLIEQSGNDDGNVSTNKNSRCGVFCRSTQNLSIAKVVMTD